jgi:thymidylate kinase
MKIVCVDGNIGAGKSTVLKKLSEMGFQTQPEKIHLWPLKLFYKNPERWSLPLHLAILNSMKNPTQGTIYERCPVSTMDVFWSLEPRDPHEDEIFREYFQTVGWKPDIHIYLKVPAKKCFENIHKRTQVGDEHVTLEYIKKVEEAYSKIKFTYVVDGTQDPDTVANTIKHLICE